MQKKKIIRILSGIILLIIAVTTAAYFFYAPFKPWLAFYIACCGGVLAVNLAISIIFVVKNFKNKK